MVRTIDDLVNELPKHRRKRIEKRADELIAEYETLQQLRKVREKSQKDIAKELHIKQAAVSKLERRTDMYISSLRSYIEAMGGELEITAKFPNNPPIKITQFSNLGND